MAWVAKKKRTRWVLGGKVVAAKTEGAEKEITYSEFFYAFWYTGGKLCQRQLKGCTDKKEAKKLLNQLLKEGVEGIVEKEEKEPSVSTYLEDYLAVVARTKRPDTHTQTTTYLGRYVKAIKGKSLHQLSFNEGLARAAGPRAGAKMTRNIASMINGFLRYICAQQNVRCPKEGFIKPTERESTKKEPVRQHGTFTKEEANKLLEGMKIPLAKRRYDKVRQERRLIYWLMLTTLTRFKTLTEVKVSQLDLSTSGEECLHLAMGQTKSNRATTKPLVPELAAALREFIEQRGLKPSSKLFTLDYKCFFRSFRKDLVRCGLRTEDPAGRILAPHSLKATGITLLIDQGLDVATVAELAEHTDVRVTLGVYKDSLLRKRPSLRGHLQKLNEDLTNGQGDTESPGAVKGS